MRKIVRMIAWGVKGVLAVVAVAALVAWPLTYWHPRVTEGERYTMNDIGVTRDWVARGWAAGRVGLASTQVNVMCGRGTPPWSRAVAAGPNWTWRRALVTSIEILANVRSSGEPVRWTSEEDFGDGYSTSLRLVSAPLWLLALLTGAWPLASLALSIRRRRRAARRAAGNRCRRRGYDLRATPSPDGPALATCPECGNTEKV